MSFQGNCLWLPFLFVCYIMQKTLIIKDYKHETIIKMDGRKDF